LFWPNSFWSQKCRACAPIGSDMPLPSHGSIRKWGSCNSNSSVSLSST
jgi:hypothetical protein